MRADEEKNRHSEKINLKNIFTVKGGIVECFCFVFDAFLFSFLFISYFLLYYTFFCIGLGKCPKPSTRRFSEPLGRARIERCLAAAAAAASGGGGGTH